MPNAASIEAAFKVFDENGDGTLSASELKAVLTRPIRGQPAKLKPEDIDQMIRDFVSKIKIPQSA